MRIEITVAFGTYLSDEANPEGRPLRNFTPGDRPEDLPEGWPELLVAKGLARDLDAPAAE